MSNNFVIIIIVDVVLIENKLLIFKNQKRKTIWNMLPNFDLILMYWTLKQFRSNIYIKYTVWNMMVSKKHFLSWVKIKSTWINQTYIGKCSNDIWNNRCSNIAIYGWSTMIWKVHCLQCAGNKAWADMLVLQKFQTSILIKIKFIARAIELGPKLVEIMLLVQ